MLKSYFTIALRNFLRNKVISVVNIGGLMLGLTTGIIICMLMVYVFGADKFHANYKAIYLVEMNQNYAGNIYTNSWTPSPLGAALRSEIPALKYVVRVRKENQSLTRFEEKAVYQESIYAEPDFFRIMTFPAAEGDPVTTLRNGSEKALWHGLSRRKNHSAE